MEGKQRDFQVEVLKDAADLTIEDFRFSDEENTEIPLEATLEGARLSGEYEKISLSVVGRVLSLDFGYQGRWSSMYRMDFCTMWILMAPYFPGFLSRLLLDLNNFIPFLQERLYLDFLYTTSLGCSGSGKGNRDFSFLLSTVRSSWHAECPWKRRLLY